MAHIQRRSFLIVLAVLLWASPGLSGQAVATPSDGPQLGQEMLLRGAHVARSLASPAWQGSVRSQARTPGVLATGTERRAEQAGATSTGRLGRFGRRAPLPRVSYAADVHPIWGNRGCTSCHPNSGGLDLSGPASATYGEVISRVDLANPTASEILRKPLAPAAGGLNHNGGIFFATTSDPDYQTILAWILQGAPSN